MPGIGNNLYPPIVDTYMPAFVRTMACKVYFSLSIYNKAEDIKNVQVIVSNQNTNRSVLNSELYPAEVKITNLQLDTSINGDNKYFITINPEDLDGGIFELNQYYKVQIRFTGNGAAPLTDTKKISAWLVNNQKFFSEWSTVCLIKGIQQPLLYLRGFEQSSELDQTLFTTEVVDFIGNMYFEENSEIEKEYLKYFRIQIYKSIADILLYDSGIVYTNEYNPNEINYNLKYALEDGISYKAKVTYTTNNEYSNSYEYIFSIIRNGIDPLKATITAEPDEENGRVKINIVSTTSEAFLGNITIRRTSSKSDFTIWEDVKTVTLNDGTSLNLTWYDYTVESGVWYKYCAQKRNSKGNRGSIINIRYPIILNFDDMFLVNKDMQLNIKYDPSISSFRKTISESKIDTIGSKYPHFRRNGNIGYRQFPISGLITCFCDEEGIFLNKDVIYGNNKIDYDNYNDENNIIIYQDYFYEREFRKRVMDFLYSNTAKLFRSTTEGNILVKLMDISFTPNQTLGRMLYSFSATAYELDECSIENFDKYDIQPLGNYSSHIEYRYDKIGQIKEIFNGPQKNVIALIQNEYNQKTTVGFLNTIQYLKWLRLEFNSDPYLIKINSNNNLIPLQQGEQPDENTALGYIVYINEQPILVSAKGYYELKDEDTAITSVWFPIDTNVTIDYIAQIEQLEDTSKLANKIYYHTKVGQLWGIFKSKESLFHEIYLKYRLNYKSYYQQLISIDEINAEATPGTILYVKDSFDDAYYKHIIGETGVLKLRDEEAIITGFYFYGMHFNEVKDETRDELKDNEYIETEISVNSITEITEPIKNGVYLINSKRVIFYHGNWYEIDDNNEIVCDVEGLVDYIYEVIKGEY